MYSSEDEQDDTSIFDQLKSIKPFTIDQLYLLHPDVGRPPSTSLIEAAADGTTTTTHYNENTHTTEETTSYDKDIYQALIEYEQLKNKLLELRGDVKRLHKKTFDHVDKAWIFKEESARKIAMCQSGKIAETTFKYKQAVLNSKQLEIFSLGFNKLAEIISKDYIYYSFESQVKRNKIVTQFSISYQTQDDYARKAKLKLSISTLTEFLKHLGDSKTDLVVQYRKWLRALAKRFLEFGTTDDYRFIISQIAKGPAGTSDWTADLVECKPFDQVNNFDTVPQYVTHCSALLNELFYNLKARLRQVMINTTNEDRESGGGGVEKSSSDQNWSLIDPRFNCSEELNVTSSSGNLLSEADVIKICLKISVPQIFRAYVKKCLRSNEFHLETDKNYEYLMLKLLTIGTIIIKTYQTGLETFNSIQYGNLIEYLSSQIRYTVIILSEQWTEFKSRLRGVDDALLMRLQVEYDNFILRSILIILELRESGIWRHLSRRVPGEQETGGLDGDNPHGHHHAWTPEGIRPAFAKLLQVTGLSTSLGASGIPGQSIEVNVNNTAAERDSQSPLNSLTYEFSIEWFREVSEPMLWHILWQFYHNAFVSSCDYHSDNYWLEKFRENSVIYLFVNKIRDSSPGECSYLLNSITSMALSRTRSDSKIVEFIATELFNLSFKHPALRDKVTKIGIKSLRRSAEKFPNLISVYIQLMDTGELVKDVVDLIRGCSLSNWLCNNDEIDLLANWLIEYPLESPRNQVARLIISKLLLNSPESRTNNYLIESDSKSLINSPNTPSRSSKRSFKSANCFVDLKLRRRIALLLYEASVRHLPETNDFGPQSLGASVEVAFGGLYCERNAAAQNNLLELAEDTSYQQFYVWAWRLLFTLRLHILNQPETDWNDVQSRSGTSRSIKNTVLLADAFHPAPTIQDSECLSLSMGVRNQNPIASYIYLTLTDATWELNSLDTCLVHLNVLANSGHITPSLMAMKFLAICHLNDLNEKLSKDKRIIDYFTVILCSNFDATRFASLIATQLSHLKQFRQLQLSEFYISVLLEVSTVIGRQISSSWFTSNELSLEKIACLLDYIVKFNFSTQRLEIIQKFYDCSYSSMSQGGHIGGGSGDSWFNSFFASNSLSAANSSKREFLTNLHGLILKFKKYTWLRWVTTECDSIRLEKIWEDIVVYLSSNEEANLDAAIKKVCPQVNASVLKSMLPIYSWIKQIFDIVEIDLNHPLCPLIWYNFYLNYFANSLNGVSVGSKLIPQETISRLMARLDSLFNYHLYKHRNWASASNMQQNSLAQLYRAYKLWLQDPTLREAYVDIDRLKDDYSVPILKAVMGSSTEDSCLQYVDVQSIETQNKNLMQVWSTATQLMGNQYGKEMVFVDSKADESMEILTSVDDEASDAVSMCAKPSTPAVTTTGAAAAAAGTTSTTTTPSQLNNDQSNRLQQRQQQQQHHHHLDNSGEIELAKPLREELLIGGDEQQQYRTTDELLDLIKRNFHHVFEESTLFGLNLSELDRTKLEIIELIQQLYTNKKREFVRVVPCIEGDECPGPAKIKLEAEEAFMDERKSQCIQDRRRQCQEYIGELLMMPKNRTVQSTVIIEENVRRLVNGGDSARAKLVIESLLKWISMADTYKQLNGSYYAANHLLKTVLEILSITDQVDTYNTALIDVCLEHPESVQIFSPHLSPSVCSHECFLELYKTITSKQTQLGPMATFVLLSKFDINSWLNNIASSGRQNNGGSSNNNSTSNNKMHHELIQTTCAALKGLGKQPDDSCELTFDLFKRHLQIELAPPDRRRPEEISLVVREFLCIMSDQSLAPSLWIDLMAIIGLERNVVSKSSASNMRSDHRGSLRGFTSTSTTPHRSSSVKSFQIHDSSSMSTTNQQQHPDDSLSDLLPIKEFDEITFASTIDDVARLADGQMIFDYHSLESCMQMLGEFINEKYSQHKDVTLLELFQDYLDQFGIVLLSFTLMWLKSTSEQYPDNHELIWRQFVEVWMNWVFLDRNCQNVAKGSYSLFANYFVASLRFMIHKIPDNSQSILQSILTILTDYTKTTKQVIYLELTILQRCLKNLTWSQLTPNAQDIENLAQLCQQENYNVSDLVSHIILQLDMKQSLTRIYKLEPHLMPHVVERFVTSIVFQSNHLKGYRIHGRYLSLIPVEKIAAIASLILPRMESFNLEHSQNNRLLVNLMRSMCIRLDYAASDADSSKTLQQRDSTSPASEMTTPTATATTMTTTDSFNRSLIYAQFVSNYLIDLIRRHPVVVKHNQAYLFAVMDNSLQDLKMLNSPDLSSFQKTTLYENLLECCSCDLLVESGSRLLLARTVVESTLLKNKPIVLLELLHAVGQIVRDSQVLVFLIETLICDYLKIGGYYEKVWKSFCLRILPSDIYLSACVEERRPLALLVYFESLSRGNQTMTDDGQDDDSTSRSKHDNRATNVFDETKSTSSDSHLQFNNTRVWSSFLHWLAQLTSTVIIANSSSQQPVSTQQQQQDSKLIAVWLRMLDLFEQNLHQYLSVQTTTTTGMKEQQHDQHYLPQKAEESAATDRTSQKSLTGDNQAETGSGGGGDTEVPKKTALPASQSTTDEHQSSGKQSRSDQNTGAALLACHRCLIDAVKQLISLYDSVNSGGLWSYLRSSLRSEQSSKISLSALAIATFLVDRVSACLSGGFSGGSKMPDNLAVLRDEINKLRKSCLTKLEAAKKSKNYLEHSQFIETLIESAQHNDRVQYREGLELITTFVRLAYVSTPQQQQSSTNSASTTTTPSKQASTSNMATDCDNQCAYIDKILPSFEQDSRNHR